MTRNKNIILWLVKLNMFLAPFFGIASWLTGLALLSNINNRYNPIEIAIIGTISIPFLILATSFNMSFDADIDNVEYSFGRIITGITANSIISILIGYLIYDGFNETEMRIEETLAASAVGSSLLVIPYTSFIAGTVCLIMKEERKDYKFEIEDITQKKK